MSTIKSRHPQARSIDSKCKVASEATTLGTQQSVYEPQTVPPRSIPVSELQYNLDRWAERNQSLVITTAGKTGMGMSTMINNFLDLSQDKMSPTGDDVGPTTTEVKKHSNYMYKSRIQIEIHEIPGLGGAQKNETAVLKGISKETDILLYNVSLHPSAKIDITDVENIKLLTVVYGRKIWSQAVLVLTFANQRSSKNEETYKRLIEGYARNFQHALHTAKIISMECKSIFSEEVPTAAGVIPAVPIGLDPREPLLLCENWSDVLLHEVLKRVQIK